MPALVERTAETHLIDQILNAAMTGQRGGLLLVEGPAGIGKTSLLEHARVQAEKLGFTVAGTTTGQRRLEMLTESVQLLKETDARLEHATSLYRLGEALRRSGHLPDARAHLNAALELANLCGARPLRQAVFDALGALRSGPVSGPGM